MSQFSIYIKLEKYLHQWVTHHFGSPVVFPAQSNANAVIRTFLTRVPPGRLPETDNGVLTPIAIPDSKAKPPAYFHFMGRKGKHAVREVVKDLFLRNLWSDLSPLEDVNIGLNSRIGAWCELHGIDLDYVETVRQCYYRIRDSYAKAGVNLRSPTRK